MIHTKNIQKIFTLCNIQVLIFGIMATPLLALTTNSPAPVPPQKEASFAQLLPSNVLFTEDVLLEVLARSRIDCSKKCVETEGCVMCTFLSSPQGPPGHCRLHSQLQNFNDAKKSMPGAKSVARGRCGRGFMLSCDRCLKAVNKRVTYTTSAQGCTGLQAVLVMPKTQAEVDCLWAFQKSNSFTRAWVGGNDRELAREFRWNDGTLLPGNSSLWCKPNPEPDHVSPGDDCLNLREEHSAIFDSQCRRKYLYICQKDFVE